MPRIVRDGVIYAPDAPELDPNYQPEAADDPAAAADAALIEAGASRAGSWWTFPDGAKFLGRSKAAAYLASMADGS